jgi:putative glutamine amidotransferase
MKTNGLKPVIGITMSFDKSGLVRPDVDYNLIRREYSEQLKAAGASPIFLDNTIDPEVAAELCDGIVISGGEDIDPKIYGQDAKYVKVIEPTERTLWERQLINACDQRNVRILGICYGSQLLNIHYGGTLYQDIAAETGSHLDHGKSTAPAMHKVTFKNDFLGFKNDQVVESAARHHQAVHKLGKGMEAAAVAEDGIIEAIAGNGHFGVQWHAESDGTASQIYSSFVKLVRQPILEDNEGFAIDPSLQPDLA